MQNNNSIAGWIKYARNNLKSAIREMEAQCNQTGEFDFYSDFIMTLEESSAKAEEFEDDAWIATPRQQEIGEYDMMSDFVDSVTDPRKNEMLSIALDGKGAFRRFKDTLSRVGLEDEWYAFKRNAYAEVARDWCEENDIEYTDDIGVGETESVQASENYDSDKSVFVLGKTASARTVVSENNTAAAVWSGALDVFSTPMMIALMERAACECLTDVLHLGETSVGIDINVSHTAASPIGAEITATAVIEAVHGRRIEFTVTASDKSGEIGKGKHNRVIVDTEKFMKKADMEHSKYPIKPTK